MRKNSSNGVFRYSLTNKSVALLIFSNIITIIFAVIDNWDLFVIFFVYLCQTVIIGFFTAIRILYLKNDSFYGIASGSISDKNFKLVKVFSASFYLVVVYSVLWLYFNICRNFLSSSQNPVNLTTFFVIISIVAFFINHLFSFYYNKERDALKKRTFPKVIMHSMYRISAINLGIVGFGWFFSIFFQLSIVNLIIFLSVKTAYDVRIHILEHK